MTKSIIKATLQRFIRNIDYPICSQCAFFWQTSSKKSSPYCTKFGEKNLLTGEIKYENITVSRSKTNMCGEKGVYFIENQ